MVWNNDKYGYSFDYHMYGAYILWWRKYDKKY